MKKAIHPEMHEVTITCACGQSYSVHSVSKKVQVDVCAACHPFFTGQQKFVDRAGRIEKFQRRFGTNSKK